MTLDAEEFIRRFLAHVLPPGFPRIRHFGFLANRHKKEKLALCRKLLTSPAEEMLPAPPDCLEARVTLALTLPRRCPRCGLGTMIRVEIVPAYRWPARPPDSS